MICEFCGKEIDENNKFCPNCGAGLTEEAQAEAIKNSEAEAKMNEQFFTSANKAKTEEQKTESAPSQQTGEKKKKKVSPGKIILIVFLISALIVGLFTLGAYLLFRFVRHETKDFDIDEFERYFEEDYDEEDIEDYFEDYFSKRFGDDFGFDIDGFDEYDESGNKINGNGGNVKGEYKGAKDFKTGKVDREKNTYSSEFLGIDFQLPTGYSIYSEKKLADLYDKQYIPNGLVSNKLYLYDIYADNNINGATFYISFFNKDYFSDEYDNLADFIEEVKDASEDYEEYNYTVSFAKDSKITLDGAEYTMIAARITTDSNDKEYYQYDFVREVNGYYAQISLFTESLDDVEEIIDAINAKG